MEEEDFPKVVKATFKARSLKHINILLQALRNAVGKENVNALSPTFVFRSKIYIVDMDIRIPKALLRRYALDFLDPKTSSGGTEQQ